MKKFIISDIEFEGEIKLQTSFSQCEEVVMLNWDSERGTHTLASIY